MIIACPQCDTRFVVPSTVFAKGGRKVRCASCKHEWFQEEPLDKKEESESEGFASAMEKAKGESSNFDDNEDGAFLSKIKNDFKTGAKVILAACATVLFIYFAYQFLKPSLIQGEGLAFNNVQVEQGENGLTLSGEIVNTVDEKRGIPSLKVISILANDVKGDTVLMAPEKDVLESGEVYTFSYTLDNIPLESSAVTVTFAGQGNDNH